MLIEQSAYNNRWRKVAPVAKGIFALGGFIAAFVAKVPVAAVVVAFLMTAVTVMGAGIPAGRYTRIAAPALFFLGMSCLSLAFSLSLTNDAQSLSLHLSQTGMQKVFEVSARSLGALAALLFLALTTPMIDLISLLRSLKVPEVLLDIMVLCYRMLFVLSEAVHDTLTAQSARLGYATPRLVINSLGKLVANLTLQVWQRAHSLHFASQARNSEGQLRFIELTFDHTGRDMALATTGGVALILLVLVIGRI